jgi:hypothetical protein
MSSSTIWGRISEEQEGDEIGADMLNDRVAWYHILG